MVPRSGYIDLHGMWYLRERMSTFCMTKQRRLLRRLYGRMPVSITAITAAISVLSVQLLMLAMILAGFRRFCEKREVCPIQHRIADVDAALEGNVSGQQKQETGKKPLWIKICVPVFIVALICGIWLLKCADENPETDALTALEDGNFDLNETEMIDYEALSEYGLPMIVDYGSDSCVPCKAMQPALETLNEEMSGKAFIKFVDVWKYTDAANNVPIQVIPTQVLFNGMEHRLSPAMRLRLKFRLPCIPTRKQENTFLRFIKEV